MSKKEAKISLFQPMYALSLGIFFICLTTQVASEFLLVLAFLMLGMGSIYLGLWLYEERLYEQSR